MGQTLFEVYCILLILLFLVEDRALDLSGDLYVCYCSRKCVLVLER